MQSVRRLLARWRPYLARPVRDNLEVKAEYLKDAQPLYERKPPWWARFPATLLVAELAVTSVSILSIIRQGLIFALDAAAGRWLSHEDRVYQKHLLQVQICTREWRVSDLAFAFSS